MVNPINSQSPLLSKPMGKKKSSKEKEVDQRVKKVAKKSNASLQQKSGRSIKASQKMDSERAAAERTVNAARQRAFEAKEAAVKAQKAALLAQRAHMAQQSAAARRARAEEKAKRVAGKAAKKAHELRRVMKVIPIVGNKDIN